MAPTSSAGPGPDDAEPQSDLMGRARARLHAGQLVVGAPVAERLAGPAGADDADGLAEGPAGLSGAAAGTARSGSVRANAGECAGKQILFPRRERIEQELADRLRVHADSPAEHFLARWGDGDKHSAPVIGGARAR